MYNKNDVLLKLNADNYYIDRRTLSAFLDLWKIDAVYEDENNEEYYDDFAIEKLKKGINLKAQGFSDDQIIHKLGFANCESMQTTQITPVEDPQEQPVVRPKAELNNLTLDISTQTLQMLAETVAKKITDDIKNTDMATKLIEAGGYKRDNEILSEQLKELIEDNKKLAQRVEQLETNKSLFKKIIKLIKQHF